MKAVAPAALSLLIVSGSIGVLGSPETAQPASAERFRLTVCPTGPGNPRNGEGDIIELRDGSLLLAYTKWIGAGGDLDNAELVGKISEDGGRTWGEEFLIQRNDAQMNVAGLSLLRMRSGNIILAYGRVNSTSDCFTVVRFSSNEGKTWGPEIRANPDPGYEFQENDKSVQLSTGRLLSPVCWTPDFSKDTTLRSFCYYSDDRGYTWHRGKGMVEVPGGAQEPAAVELKDGRVMMIFRSTGGYVGQAYSGDGGDTWTDPEMIQGMPCPCGPQSLERIPSTGDLLLIWENNPKAPEGDGMRTPLTAAVSRDDGATWEHYRDIATDPAIYYGYTSVTFVKDRVLLTYYESWGNLILESMPVSWFYGE